MPNKYNLPHNSWLIVILSLIILLTACTSGTLIFTSGEATDATSLADIADIEELKSVFNQEAGAVRILLLLSPT